MKQRLSFRDLALAVALISAAACVRYHPRPIAPVKTMEECEARRAKTPA